jgi:pyruvate dehydrogenase E2 component (dihydrolipoamide acetyltransferase)
MEVDMTRGLEYADKIKVNTGIKVTPTHLAVRAVALALRKIPQANSIIRLRRIYRRKNVDIFCQVALPGEKPDLSGVVIRNADAKTPSMLAEELSLRAETVRKGEDKELASTKRALDLTPALMYPLVLRILGLLQYSLNLDLGFTGLPRDPFGSAMVTSIGSLGLSEGFAPLVPMSRTPIVVSVGKVEMKPVADQGKVVIKPVCVLGGCFDHRIMDGILAGELTREVSRYLADPEYCETEISQGRIR